MRLFIFESNAKTGLRAFVGDVAGRNLPDQFSPWRQIGAVASGNAPPYKLSRDTIEKGHQRSWLSALARQTKDGIKLAGFA
jgi:hypothetical protein